jgi:hypothetical protein
MLKSERSSGFSPAVTSKVVLKLSLATSSKA